jgi:hypothetical protein
MRLVGIVGLTVILLCTCIAIGVSRARSQARMLLEDVKHLDVSADASSSLRAFRQKHRHQVVSEECRDRLCQYEFVVSNWPVSSLYLAPRTELRARVTVFRDELEATGVDYTSAVSRENSPVVHIQEDFCADQRDISCYHFAVNPHGRNVTPTWNGIVEFGQLATNEQKQAAWGLNLDCFVALHGCKDISILSPRIWRATGVESVSSCMRSSADSIAEASQPLSEACPGR